jgi:hypothetical protein
MAIMPLNKGVLGLWMCKKMMVMRRDRPSKGRLNQKHDLQVTRSVKTPPIGQVSLF